MSVRHKIDWDDDKVSRLWNYYATTPPYSEMFFSKVFGRKLLDNSGLPMRSPISVLDFGCGPGFVWEHIREAGIGWRYTGADFSIDAVSLLSTKADGHAQFQGAHHISKLPTCFSAGQFDAVLLFEVVEHLNDTYLEETLREVSRVLKLGGVVVVSTPNEENLADATKYCPECGAIFHEWQHVRSWSEASLSSCLADFGFRLVKVKKLDFAATGMLGKIINAVYMLIGKKTRKPHMIAVFGKYI